jgi:hypothetical protein
VVILVEGRLAVSCVVDVVLITEVDVSVEGLEIVLVTVPELEI